MPDGHVNIISQYATLIISGLIFIVQLLVVFIFKSYISQNKEIWKLIREAQKERSEIRERISNVEHICEERHK